MAIINQEFGINWAFYEADCVFGMRSLPPKSVDFSVFSPPFLALYIYSNSIADLGNTDSEAQFFEGWHFHLKELFRIHKDESRIAIHCKDTMRYMTSHGYAGLYDFPGHIIRLCEQVGFTFERWITVWKDPVIEMQRTKTYGLLHKSFKERAEVTRQGCADFVLIFNKNGDRQVNDILPQINEQVIERCVQQWTNENEKISTPLGISIRNRREALLLSELAQYSFWSLFDNQYTPNFIQELLDRTTPGRLTTIHCTPKMMTDLIQRFELVRGWKFHSRCALTDGSFLITFRNWSGQFENKVVKHSIIVPDVDYGKIEILEKYTLETNGDVEVVYETLAEKVYPIIKGDESHPDYVGNSPPVGWRDKGYYSILLWQRYASPIWFDLEDLPDIHSDCWMNIIQTNVLNYRQAKGEEEKHICPLQLDLIELLIREFTQPGDIVNTPYGGIGSEGYEAIKLGRKAILFELKSEYWKLGCKNLRNAELEITQERMI